LNFGFLIFYKQPIFLHWVFYHFLSNEFCTSFIDIKLSWSHTCPMCIWFIIYAFFFHVVCALDVRNKSKIVQYTYFIINFYWVYKTKNVHYTCIYHIWKHITQRLLTLYLHPNWFPYWNFDNSLFKIFILSIIKLYIDLII
jgi:hypothetical protein